MATDLASPVSFATPQLTPPTPYSFALPLQPDDVQRLGSEYGRQIEWALQARRTGPAQAYRWYGDQDNATKVTRVDAPLVGPRAKTFDEEIIDNWNRYDLVPPDRLLPFEGAANYRVPLTKWMLDAVLARIIAGVATIRPFMRVEATDTQDTGELERAAKIEEFLDWVLEQEIEFQQFMDAALLQAGVEGAGVAYVTWAKESLHQLTEQVGTEEKPVVDEFGTPRLDHNGLPITRRTPTSQIVERTDMIESKPHIDLIPMSDFLVGNPRRKYLKDQPWCGHRTQLYRAELVALKGQEGYFDDQIDAVLAGSANVVSDPSTLRADRAEDTRTGIAAEQQIRYPQMRMLDVFDIWTLIAWYDWDLDGKPERVVLEVAMPIRRCIRCIKYPYLHNRPFYVPIILTPRTRSFYPRALASDLKPTQDEVDAIHNQRSDATAIAIASLFMFLYDEQAGYDPGRTQIALGQSIKLDGDINHIQTLAKAFRGVNVPGMDIENILLEYAKELMGIHEMQTGGMESKRATAFEIGAVIQEGNVKFRRMIERVAGALAEIAYQIIALYQQHGDRAQPKFYQVLNDMDNPFRTIDMSEIAGRWHFRVHGMAIGDQRDIDAKKAMNMLELVSQSPIFQKLVSGTGNATPREYALAKTFLEKIGWPVEPTIGKESELQPVAPPAPPGGPNVPPEVEAMVHKIQSKTAGGGGGGGQPSAPTPPPVPASPGGQAVAEGTGL